MQFAVVFGDAVLLQLNRCLRRPFDDGFVIRGLIPRFGGNTLKSVTLFFTHLIPTYLSGMLGSKMCWQLVAGLLQLFLCRSN